MQLLGCTCQAVVLLQAQIMGSVYLDNRLCDDFLKWLPIIHNIKGLKNLNEKVLFFALESTWRYKTTCLPRFDIAYYNLFVGFYFAF